MNEMKKQNLIKTLLLPSVLVLSTALTFGQCQSKPKPTRIFSILEQQIIQETSRHQTVMFGETHADGYSPSFDIIIPLFPKLKKQGFDYFAVEIPKNCQDLVDGAASGRLSKRDYLIELSARTSSPLICSEGLYPLISAAHKNNIKVIAYDSWDLPVLSNERDEKEFSNLYALIFKDKPTAKVLLYCGAIHVSEASFAQADTSQEKSSKEIEQKGNTFIMTIESISPLGERLSEFTKDKNFSLDLSGGYAHYPDAIIVNGKYLRVK